MILSTPPLPKSFGIAPAFTLCMENKNQETEKNKTEDSLQKIKKSLSEALEKKYFWGLEQKMQTLQRSLHLQGRI